MAERDLIEQLNQALDVMLSRTGAAPAPGDTPIAEMVRIAAGLRDFPGEEFREHLKSELADAARAMILKAREEKAMIAATYLPQGFRTVTPYMHVRGAAQFIDFLKQAFGAEEKFRYNTPEGTIMHAEILVGDSMMEMGDTDPLPMALHMYVPDADAVYRSALAAGATSERAPVDQPYGDREASVKDPFGNRWYIATHQGGSYVPEGLHTITPYLHPKGTPAVIDFLKKAFDAEVVERNESPDGTVVHAKVRIGDSMVEMGEAHGQWQPLPSVLHLYVPDADTVYQRALDAGATSKSEPRDTPYGDRSSGVTDPFGNIWYIHTHLRDVPS